uniref:Protein eva-1 n=1 Tax=Hadrurus spadix TaxID=141984 RepID=A0A1W7RAK3_9SCOR
METAWRENIILVLLVICLLSTGPSICSNLPLLSGTLKTMQVNACDGEDIKIKCWPNTLISIYSAQYGRRTDFKHKCSAGKSSLEEIETNCIAPTALKVVEATCREKRVCDIPVAPEMFGEDPCPGERKYLEIAYKCRPNTFFNKVACESQKMRLRCHKTLKIVIYSATFGATVDSIPECPHLPGLPGEDCQASYATETVMASCHGKKRCSLSVDLATFGNPGCKQGTRLFLKVVYTCVPQAILKDLEISTDADKDTEEDGDYPLVIEDPHLDGLLSTTPFPRGDTTPKRPPVDGLDRDRTGTLAPDLQSDGYATEETTDNCTTMETEARPIGFLTEWISAYTFVKANQEKFILYLTLSLGAGLLAFLIVLAGRLYFQRQRQSRRAKLHITDPLPSVFDDTAELDHYEASGARHENSVEAVRYTNRSTMSRQDSDSHPRAPLSHNYYYS